VPATAKPEVAGEVSVDARLKRMEDAYLRMEESNRRIQEQYDNLLRQYQDLSKTVNRDGRSGGRRPEGDRKPESRPGDPSQSDGPIQFHTAELLGLEDVLSEEAERVALRQQPTGAEGELGRMDRGPGLPSGPQPPAPRPFGGTQEGAIGAQGIIGRGTGIEGVGGMSRMDRIGAGAEGTDGRVSPSQQPTRPSLAGGEAEIWVYKPDAKPPTHRAVVDFGEGLEFRTDDDEYRLQFHNLTQAEFRGFPTANQGILQSQFYIPRQRWYFTGDLTKNIGFYTVINRGYGALDLLDAFMTIRFDNRLRIRIGRMKTPYLYEYFSISEGDLIAPERSIWAGNFATNRQMGMMFLGNLFEDRVSYAAGIYNGPRRSFQDFNSAKDLIGTVTTRPWLTSQMFPALKYMNLGASWDVGYQSNNPTQPTYFETANDQTGGTGAAPLSPTFLFLNKNVLETGERVQWGAHAVWFYRSFFLIAEYGGARAGYSLADRQTSTPVNFSGWFVESSYMLTGEELTRRVSVLKPRRDFNFNWLKGGEFSPGAVEVHARYSRMDIGSNIFTAGFADPNDWTNHVWATDVGLNWYLNFYTKIMLDWQHSGFGNQVAQGNGKFDSVADLFWLRFQVFF
jgi:phosphate-selective porin OprO and OprP